MDPGGFSDRWFIKSCHLVDQAGSFRRGMDHIPVRLVYEHFVDRMVEESKQVVIIMVDIQQTARLCMQPELGPGQHFEKLIECPVAPWQGDESIRHLRHLCFTGMHGIDNDANH